LLPIDRYPTALRNVVLLNPATGVTQLFHLAVDGSATDWPAAVAISVAWMVVFGIAAVYLHCKRDRVFADLL
jgi:ABC-type polysaccharide/polyol phosphate export permease